MDVVSAGKELGVKEIAQLAVAGSGIQNAPRLVGVAVVAGQMVEQNRHRREGNAPLVLLHELKHLRRLAAVGGERPGGSGLLKKNADAVFGSHHRGTGKPRVQPEPLVEAQAVASVEAAGHPPFAAQRAAGGAGTGKPGAHLHRPGLLPLPGGAARECQLRLREGDVLAQLQSDAARPPLTCIGLVVGMPVDADHAVEKIAAAVFEIPLHRLVALPLAAGHLVVAAQARRLHQMFEGVELRAIHIPPPLLVVRQPMEVVAPLPQLHGGESSLAIHRLPSGGLRRAEHAAATIDLHVGATGAHNRPAGRGEHVKQRLGVGGGPRPRVEAVPQFLFLHHRDQLFQGGKLSRHAVHREGAAGVARQGLQSKSLGQWYGGRGHEILQAISPETVARRTQMHAIGRDLSRQRAVRPEQAQANIGETHLPAVGEVGDQPVHFSDFQSIGAGGGMILGKRAEQKDLRLRQFLPQPGENCFDAAGDVGGRVMGRGDNIVDANHQHHQSGTEPVHGTVVELPEDVLRLTAGDADRGGPPGHKRAVPHFPADVAPAGSD